MDLTYSECSEYSDLCPKLCFTGETVSRHINRGGGGESQQSYGPFQQKISEKTPVEMTTNFNLFWSLSLLWGCYYVYRVARGESTSFVRHISTYSHFDTPNQPIIIHPCIVEMNPIRPGLRRSSLRPRHLISDQ